MTFGDGGVDVVVVGAGIVGLATARALLDADPGLRVAVVEAETRVGQHQSSHNSGVLHAGVYYPPGSAKAELCRTGAAAMRRFCEEHAIPVVRTGKLVVAVDGSELDRFESLVERATANRVPELRVLGPDEMREIEPHVVGRRALHSPTTAVVDFGAVCLALAGELDVRTGHRVRSIEETSGGVRVRTSAGDLEAGTVVVCGGLGAERLAAAAGCPTDLRIVPFRGSWTELTAEGADLVRGSIYPVPDPALPFLGVHLTRRFDGRVWAGPNAVLSLSQPRLLARAARHPGFWRLAWSHRRAAVRELVEDHSRRLHLRQLRRYVPELDRSHLVAGTRGHGGRPHGIRAQAVAADGHLVDDFVIEDTRRVVHVLNAPSPAATSSLAIGSLVARRVLARR